jgi:thiol-disulfide isomerase/thioredoxin
MKKFVVFSADWCQPGKKITDALQVFADKNKIILEVHDLESELAKKNRVRSSPVIYIYATPKSRTYQYRLYGYHIPSQWEKEMVEIIGTDVKTKSFDQILAGLIGEI